MRILQISEALAIGDAVANDVVAIDKWLKEKGIPCGIYVTNKNNIASKYLHTIAETIDCLPNVQEDDLILFHHAICNDFCYKLRKLKCRKALVYHNITPPEFFAEYETGIEKATKLGLEQTEEIADVFDFCIADSEFNKQNLIDMGYKCPIYVCPVLVPFRDYDQEPNKDIISYYKNRKGTNVLFVGRISPQKKQEDIIHAFAIYKKYYDADARLFLVGSDGMQGYANYVRNYANEHAVRDVYVTGSVPFTDILAYYSIADLFLCMSEHEGFCVPLLEAMYFDVPIIAYDSTAIGGTLGGTGILLTEKKYEMIAGWMHQVATNKELRQTLIAEQWEYLQSFSYRNVTVILETILQTNYGDKITKPKKDDFTNTISRAQKYKNFEVVIPIKASDWSMTQKTVEYVTKYIKPKRIVIVSSHELKAVFNETDYLKCLDEDQLLPGMTIDNIRHTIWRAGGRPKTAGWYLQQFIKLGYARITKDPYYLVWDADTLPVAELDFFDKDSKPYFNLKREYVEPYFDTLETLLGLTKCRNESYITEHMLFDSAICRNMLTKMEKNTKINGECFWEKCIYAVDFDNTELGFSEFETYGTFTMQHYPKAYATRKLNTLRSGQFFVGENPSNDVLEWVGKEFETISFEHFDEFYGKKPFENALYRGMVKCSTMIKRKVNKFKKLSKTGSGKYVDIYSLLLRKMDFDYFFGDDTVYERSKKG